MGGKVGENPAALRAAVFSLVSKNLRGAFKRPPPSRARVKNIKIENLEKTNSFWDHHDSKFQRYIAFMGLDNFIIGYWPSTEGLQRDHYKMPEGILPWPFIGEV